MTALTLDVMWLKFVLHLQCSRVFIDLATGDLLEPNPAMRHSKMAGVSYDAHASCPRFMRFLKDIFPDDPELRGYAQKVVGYTLTGSTGVLT